MLKLKIRRNIKFPKFDFTEDLEQIAERIVIPTIAGNIQNKVDITGIAYPPLDEKTIKIKSAYSANPSHPLIAAGKLHKSFKYKRKGKNRVLIYVNAGRKKIAEYLQLDGIKSKKYKKRFFNFFGVSKDMEENAVEFMRKKIREKIANA